MNPAHATALALALPDVHEEPHFEAQSFRIGKQIIATIPPDGDALHVFVDAATVRSAIASAPDSCTELRWGKQLAGIRVQLATADPDQVEGLLESAWRRRASKKAIAARDSRCRGDG